MDLASPLRVSGDSLPAVEHEVCYAPRRGRRGAQRGSPDAHARIERLDSLMRHGANAGTTAPTNLTLGRLFAERGEPARALRPSRRRTVADWSGFRHEHVWSGSNANHEKRRPVDDRPPFFHA